MDDATQLFAIPAVNFDAFEVAMRKLAHRAERLGSAPVGFTVVRRYVAKRRLVGADGRATTAHSPMVEVEVFGPRPRFDGWTFVGRLDFTSAAPAVLRMMVPGERCPDAFYDVEPGRCDHCHASRQRKDSFLVRHDDGRVLVVGRQCLADFLGHQAPETIAALATCVLDVFAAATDAERDGYGGVDVWEPATVLAIACYSVRTTGWAPSQSDLSTRDAVSMMLTPAREPAESERLRALREITDGDRAKAAAILEWSQGATPDSDYLHNVKAVLSNGIVYRTLGIAVSAVVAYDRAMEREIARKHRESGRDGCSTHVGKAGDRVEFDGEVLAVRYSDSAWGTTTIVKLRDDGGNVFTWFASNMPEVETGARVRVKGTVKKHEIYRNEHQTVLTRCKLTAAV